MAHRPSLSRTLTTFILGLGLMTALGGCDAVNPALELNNQGELETYDDEETDTADAGVDTADLGVTPDLVEDDIYEAVLNDDVTNLDLSLDVRGATVEAGVECVAFAGLATDGSRLSFGSDCTEVRLDLGENATLVISRGELVFSSTYRFMGRVVVEPEMKGSELVLTLAPVSLDDIFWQLRVEGTLPVTPTLESHEAALEQEVSTIRQALTADAGRGFDFDEQVAVALPFIGQGDLNLSGNLNISGEVKVSVNVGLFVPDDEEYVVVELDVEARAKASLDVDLPLSRKDSISSSPIEVSIPLRFGLLFADVVFDVSAGLLTELEGRMEAGMAWDMAQQFNAVLSWSSAQGWVTEVAKAPSQPWSVESHASAEGSGVVAAFLELGTTFSLYKSLGVKVTVQPQLEATAKGNVDFVQTSSKQELNTDGCFEIKAKVDLSVDSKIRWLEDKNIYESTVTDTTLYAVGECDEGDDDEVDDAVDVDDQALEDQASDEGLPFELDLDGLIFSCTSSKYESCKEYRYNGTASLRVYTGIATRCHEDPERTLSAEPCAGESLIGSCHDANDEITNFYYSGERWNCLTDVVCLGQSTTWTWGNVCPAQ